VYGCARLDAPPEMELEQLPPLMDKPANQKNRSMKTKFTKILFTVLAVWLLTSALCLPVFAQGTAFTYQGRLNDGGNPAGGIYDLRFALYDAASVGTQQGGTVDVPDAPVTNGLFTVTLDFGGGVFTGAARWLDIAVRPGASVGTFTNLIPRQPITATPYAITAGNLNGALSSASLSGTYGNAVTLNNAANSFTGNGTGLTNVNAISLGGFSASSFWKLGGNAGTTPGTQFLGTSDNLPVEIRVNGARALRLEPTANGTPNIIAGSAANSVAAGVFGVAISGGANNLADTGTAFATIAGGQINAIHAGGSESSIGGGYRNTIETFDATIGGGAVNTIETNSQYSAIGGGTFNRILAGAAVAAIGGGSGNLIESNAPYSVIPGGVLNTAGGQYSFAAGRRAKAMHQGGFVWADSQDADFTSTASNQFLIRAAGGVGINKNNPNGAALAVNGFVTVEGVVYANGLSAATVTTPEVITEKVRTAGNVPMEFSVNNQRALRIEPTAFPDTVNVIGGSAVNVVGAGAVGATIGGGGSGIYLGLARINQVQADFGTVSGGGENTILPGARYATISGGSKNMIQPDALYGAVGGGSENKIQTNAWFGTIAGGDRNAIQLNTDDAFIGGGRFNRIQPDADLATIGGGRENTIQDNAAHATIGGGGDNTILTNAQYATIPGGQENSATSYAFAAGRRAKANHTGAFVWADSTAADFASTSSNQFLIRASGGVGINLNNPQSTLHVNGTARIEGANNWGVSGGEGDFRVGNDSYRFKIGVANGGGGAGDVWMRAHGGIERINVKAPGGTRFLSNEAETSGVSLAAGGTAWAVISDRNVKKDFAAVDSVQILEKLAAMPITQWHYQWEASDITPHIGPMAQDFKAAFYPGSDDKTITTQEADGVALAAIQGLNQKLEEKDARIAELERRLEKLERLMNHKNGGAK
jgi:Chaperone of endosialidase